MRMVQDFSSQNSKAGNCNITIKRLSLLSNIKKIIMTALQLISPFLMRDIAEAEKEFQKGECVVCKTPQDSINLLDSL